MAVDHFEYRGPCRLTDSFGHEVKIGHARFWTEQDHSGLWHWQGVARVPGLIYRLLDVLGGEVGLILPDGRTARAFATGYSEDSAWIVELHGIGKPPQVTR